MDCLASVHNPKVPGISMAANPALLERPDGALVPAPFQGEVIALARPGVEFSIDNVRSHSGKWASRGTLWLTNLRMVLVAAAPDPETGLRAFEVPLAYISQDVFNQPIFACNNLAGRVWTVASDGSPPDASPPHHWTVYFKEGGVGTFLPLYHSFLAAVRGQHPEQPMGTHARNTQPSEQQQQQQPQQQWRQQSAEPSAPPAPRELVATAFVDPGDPSRLYLAQPVSQGEVLHERPVYAATYGQAEERYEPTGLRP